MSNITGRLINARRVPIHPTGYIIVGDIYEDARNRFPDGAEVRTSPVLSEEGAIILTANSIYEIEGWA